MSRPLYALAIGLAPWIPALAQGPLEDVGFSPVTGFPDPDLVVVRERSYSAPGVDLGAYGIGGGTQTYIQSLYFRLYTGSPTSNATANGLVVLPPGVEILGFVTDGDDLGGSVDDGIATQTDALFGIASDPDDYSARARGFAATGTEFVCKLTDREFLFHLDIGDGVDDFRAIIDYGNAFPVDLSFDLYTFGPGAFGGVAPSAGIRVGDPGLAVLGSGDHGEGPNLVGIPLTSEEPPSSMAELPFAGADSVYGVRDRNADTAVDAFDLMRGIPAPARFLSDSPGTPVGLTGGPDGLLYAVGNGSGFALFDAVSGNHATYTLDNLNGVNVSLTDYAGTRDLFLVRDAPAGTRVDRLNVDTLTFDQTFAIPSTMISHPVGITDGNDGNLYVLGRFGALVTLDPAAGTMSSQTYSPPSGTYVGITRGAAPDVHLYLARDTSLNTRVDKVDTISSAIQLGFASFPSPGNPVDVTHGPRGLIVVQGVGATGPASMIALDAVTGAEVFHHDCVDYSGTYSGVARVQPSFGENYCGPAVPNSAGESAWMSVHGSDVAGGNPLDLAAWDLPPDKFGYFLTSRSQGFIPNPGGSQGNLCLGLPIGRYASQVQNSGVLGRLRISVDTSSMPLNPPVAVLAGETWNFQAWYRDLVPFASSNFTDAIAVEFR